MASVDNPWETDGRSPEWSASSLDAATEPVWQWHPVRDEQGTIVDFTLKSANRAAWVWMEKGRGATIGSSLREQMRPEEYEPFAAALINAYDEHDHRPKTVAFGSPGDPNVVATFQIVTLPIGESIVVWGRDVGEDARRSEILAKTVHALGSATRLTNVGSFYIDLRTGELTCSPEYLRLIGVEDSDPPPTVADLIEMTHPDDRQKADHIAAILRAGESTRERFTARLRARNGRERLLVGTMSYEFNDDGHPVRVHGAVQDMSEIVAIETQAREHHDFLEAVLGGSPNGIFVKDARGRFVLANPTFASIFNRTPADLIGRDNDEIAADPTLNEYDIAQWRREDQHVIETLEEMTLEGKFLDYTGRERRFHVRKSPLVLADGTVHVLGVVTDITDETDTRDRLRVSEARFRTALFGSPIATAVIDWKARRHFVVNQAYEDFLGYSAEEIVSMNLEEFFERITFPEDRPIDELRGEDENDHVSPRTERRYRHKDGSPRWGIPSRSVVYGPDGAPDQVIVQIVDVTERHESEARVRRSEALVRALVRHSTDVVTVRAANGHISYVSPAIEGVLGYTVDEYPSDDLTSLVHPDDLEIWNDHVAAVLGREDQTHRAEVRVRNSSGTWVWVESTMFNLIDDDDVQGLVNHFHDVTDRHVAEAALAHRAMHDALTGLPNRLLLIDRMQHALSRRRNGERVSVAFLDLDRFKVVNDSLGHATGDDLLVAVAERLSTMVRPSDTVARLGGDEFVICCEDIRDDTDALDVVERILVGMRQPFRINGRDAHVTASIGVALSEPGATPETLLRDADAAMYVAKENGRDRYDVFNSDVRSRVMWRMEVEHDLHDALDQQQLTVVYQPNIDLATGAITGTEALIRWHHPTRGLLEPIRFIPVAEETGLIDQVGEWVFDQACKQLAAWHAEGHTHVATMWINLSAHQLARPDLPQRLERIVRMHALDPSSIGIEITESVLMEKRDVTSDVLAELEALGFKLAIDDFGTGYSSLSYLQRMHLDVLKIDRSFVAGLTENDSDRSIVSAVIELAHRLGMSVTAEGVETADQLAALRELHCDTACGFLIAKPASPDDLVSLFEERTTW